MRGLVKCPFFIVFLVNGKFKILVDFVKSQEDVFLGVREDYINLYVDGGSFFKLEYLPSKGYVGSIDEKYFNHCRDRMPKILKDINNVGIHDINDWITILPELKSVVKDYQESKIPDTRKEREKILQQKLVHEFNKNSDFFAYDIEYAIKDATDYLKDANKNPLRNRNPKTEGRADILLMSKPLDNKVTIYFMEVKEGIHSFSGINDKIGEESFGSGIIGHLKNNVKIINLVRNNQLYSSMYRQEKYPKKPQINLRELLLCELKNIMALYKDCGLIKNPNFKDIEYNNLSLKDNDEAIKLVFFLGNYRKDCKSFENYLGINCNENEEAKFSVRKLLDNKESKNLNLDYISSNNMIDFKYIKEEKNCEQNGFCLDIEDTNKYIEIKKKDFLNIN